MAKSGGTRVGNFLRRITGRGELTTSTGQTTSTGNVRSVDYTDSSGRSVGGSTTITTTSPSGTTTTSTRSSGGGRGGTYTTEQVNNAVVSPQSIAQKQVQSQSPSQVIQGVQSRTQSSQANRLAQQIRNNQASKYNYQSKQYLQRKQTGTYKGTPTYQIQKVTEEGPNIFSVPATQEEETYYNSQAKTILQYQPEPSGFGKVSNWMTIQRTKLQGSQTMQGAIGSFGLGVITPAVSTAGFGYNLVTNPLGTAKGLYQQAVGLPSYVKTLGPRIAQNPSYYAGVGVGVYALTKVPSPKIFVPKGKYGGLSEFEYNKAITKVNKGIGEMEKSNINWVSVQKGITENKDIVVLKGKQSGGGFVRGFDVIGRIEKFGNIKPEQISTGTGTSVIRGVVKIRTPTSLWREKAVNYLAVQKYNIGSKTPYQKLLGNIQIGEREIPVFKTLSKTGIRTKYQTGSIYKEPYKLTKRYYKKSIEPQLRNRKNVVTEEEFVDISRSNVYQFNRFVSISGGKRDIGLSMRVPSIEGEKNIGGKFISARKTSLDKSFQEQQQLKPVQQFVSTPKITKLEQVTSVKSEAITENSLKVGVITTKQITKQKQNQIPISKVIPSMRTNQEIIPLSKEVSIEKQVPIGRSLNVQKTNQMQQQAQVQKQVQVQKQAQVMRPNFASSFMNPRMVVTKKKLRLGFPLMKYSGKKAKYGGFSVSVRRRKKFKKIGVNLPYEEAVNLGVSKTRGTLARTFKITGNKQPYIPKGYYGKPSSEGLLVIEKSKFALNRPTETREIQGFKRMKGGRR